MGVRIETACVDRVQGFDEGSRALAAKSALTCWAAAQLLDEELPLLLYAGTYRDDAVMEPAQAPYVQRALACGSGPGPQLDGCFSFDVGDLMTALEISEGMVRSRGLPRAMVVAADCRVEFAAPKDGAIDAAAGAVLLVPANDRRGFVAFHSAVHARHLELHEGSLRWTVEDGPGRHALVVREHPNYLAACIEAAAGTLHDFLVEMDVALDDISLIVTSQSPEGFPSAFGRRLHLAEERVVSVAPDGGHLHTAGLLAALADAMQDGRFARAQQVLFLTVSPGITVHAALYQATP